MATFKRGHSARKILRREIHGVEPTGENTAPGKVTWVAPDPVDLRGVPLVGRGIGGAIAGTSPEREAVRRDEERRRAR